MPKPLDDALKVRCSTEFKKRLKRVAEADPDADSLSRWVRLQLRVGAQIAEREED